MKLKAKYATTVILSALMMHEAYSLELYGSFVVFLIINVMSFFGVMSKKTNEQIDKAFISAYGYSRERFIEVLRNTEASAIAMLCASLLSSISVMYASISRNMPNNTGVMIIGVLASMNSLWSIYRSAKRTKNLIATRDEWFSGVNKAVETL